MTDAEAKALQAELLYQRIRGRLERAGARDLLPKSRDFVGMFMLCMEEWHKLQKEESRG